MTPIWTLILLGIVQGLTEFLPVSSSGHLVIIQSILPGFNEPGVLFHATVHLGTLGAVLVYFREDLREMAGCAISPRTADPAKVRLIWLILVGTLPTVAIALAFKEELEQLFANVSTAAVMLLVTGTLLYLTDRTRERGTDIQKMNLGHALIIGIAQGFAIIPGISRSGSTIAAGVFSGLKRELALRYSFLLSIPAILGAFVLQLATREDPGGQGVDWIGYGFAFITAFGVGYASIGLLLKMFLSRKLTFFTYYCWALGVSVLAVKFLV
jgi:undecaprenyl-diphosphatase